MGRLGGGELGYGSDADVLFVHDPLPGADERGRAEAAHAVANELRRLLGAARPRPAARRSTPTCGPRAGRARWCGRWRRTPAYYDALVAGLGGAGAAAGRRRWPATPTLAARFIELIDPLRWPRTAASTTRSVREIRRIKARDRGRAAAARRRPARCTSSSAAAGSPTSSGPCSCCSSSTRAEVPGLRTTRDARRRCGAAARPGCSTARRRPRCSRDAWRLATRLRNAIDAGARAAGGRAADGRAASSPESPGSLGYPPATAGTLVEDYRRATRRARAVVERVFYG